MTAARARHLTVAGLLISLILMVLPLATLAGASSGGTTYPTCTVNLLGDDPLSGVTLTYAEDFYPSYQLICNNLQSNTYRVNIVIPYRGGYLSFSAIGDEATGSVPGNNTEGSCPYTYNTYLPENFSETVTETPPGTTQIADTMTCSTGVGNMAYGANWYPTDTAITTPAGDTIDLATSGGVTLFNYLSPETDGISSAGSEWGTSAPCTPTGITGYTTETANGTHTYPYTLDYTGSASVIALEPADSGTGSVTNNGKSFSNDTQFDTTPSPNTETLAVQPAAGTNPNQSEFWCFDGYSWYDMGDSLSTGNGGVPNGDAPGCTLNYISGPANFESPTAATQYNYEISSKSSYDTSVIAGDPNDGGSGSVTPQGTTGKTFSTDTVTIEAPSDDQLMTISATGGSGTYLDPHFWCYDAADTTWTDWGDYTSLAAAGKWHYVCPGTDNPNCANGNNDNNQGSGTDLSQCINDATSGLSWNLVSDVFQVVTGGASIMGCVIQWLFIPQSWGTGPLITTLKDKVPISYVSDTIGAATTFASAINTSTTEGQCDPPHIAPFATSSGFLHSLESFNIQAPMPADVCTTTLSYDTTVGEVFGYRLLFREILQYSIWLTTVLILWRMMPWSRRGDGTEVITAIGHADGYTLYSDHTASKDD